MDHALKTISYIADIGIIVADDIHKNSNTNFNNCAKNNKNNYETNISYE